MSVDGRTASLNQRVLTPMGLTVDPVEKTWIKVAA